MTDHSPLSIQDLSYKYPTQELLAFKNLNFEIANGRITGIVGPNGAGKSSVLKCCLNLLKPTSGEVKFWGESFEGQRDRIAYIPQRKSIDWDFPVSVLDVCLMGMYPRIGWIKRITKEHKQEAMSYLEMVELQDFANRPIGALSGGQQQRAFMARALAQKADLFLMDEPMAGIDQKTQTLLFNLFLDMKKDGKTIVIVHHNLQAAAEYFDEVILMNQVLIAQGKPDDVLNISMMNKAYTMGQK